MTHTIEINKKQVIKQVQKQEMVTNYHDKFKKIKIMQTAFFIWAFISSRSVSALTIILSYLCIYHLESSKYLLSVKFLVKKWITCAIAWFYYNTEYWFFYLSW